LVVVAGGVEVGSSRVTVEMVSFALGCPAGSVVVASVELGCSTIVVVVSSLEVLSLEVVGLRSEPRFKSPPAVVDSVELAEDADDVELEAT